MTIVGGAIANFADLEEKLVKHNPILILFRGSWRRKRQIYCYPMPPSNRKIITRGQDSHEASDIHYKPLQFAYLIF